jgi:hypothetical protein
MGSCGGKTCTALIRRLFRDEGIPESQVTDRTIRPLFIEVPLGVFAGMTEDARPATEQRLSSSVVRPSSSEASHG